MERDSRRPTAPALSLISKAQLAQAREELGGQKQRADMVSDLVVVSWPQGTQGVGALDPGQGGNHVLVM